MPKVREIKFIRALVFMQKGLRMGLGKSMYQEVKERNPTIAWRDVEDARTFTVTLIIKFSRTLSGTRRNACSTTS